MRTATASTSAAIRPWTGAADTAADAQRVPVVSFADFDWPPPKDWQKFERLCHLLWSKIWQDPNAQLHGRPGQQQRGVDVFGTPKGGTRVYGIQCKRKDQLLRKLLTENEVRTEVENAKEFQPPLAELIIATCAPSDVGLQALARSLTEEHAGQGLFAVHIFGWQEIQARLAEHPEVIAQVYGVQPLTPTSISTESQRAEKRTAEILAGQVELARRFEALAAQVTAPADTDGPAHAKLDTCRELLDRHEYRAALPILRRLREEEWPTASPSIRFRIATNLALLTSALAKTRQLHNYFWKPLSTNRPPIRRSPTVRLVFSY
jgi:hypothetical protein